MASTDQVDGDQLFKDVADQLRKELDTLQKDAADIGAQARWWLTLWSAVLVFFISDGGERLNRFTTESQIESDPLGSLATVLAVIFFACSGAALLWAAWPQTSGRAAVGLTIDAWYIASLRVRVRNVYRQVNTHRRATSVGLFQLLVFMLSTTVAVSRARPESRNVDSLAFLGLGLYCVGFAIIFLPSILSSAVPVSKPSLARMLQRRMRAWWQARRNPEIRKRLASRKAVRAANSAATSVASSVRRPHSPPPIP